MNHETQDFRELKFVCPKCGANSLQAEASGYLDIDHVYDDGVFEFGDMNPDDISDYQCGECGYKLEFSEDMTLSEWLMTHCSQDDPDAGDTSDQAAEVSPSESDK